MPKARIEIARCILIRIKEKNEEAKLALWRTVEPILHYYEQRKIDSHTKAVNFGE